MTIAAFLEETFSHISGGFSAWHEEARNYQAERDALIQATEYIVDQTSPQLRAISGYRRRLKGPVTDAFSYIDELVDRIPVSFLCARSSFSSDPRVKTIFVNPHHLQEVF